MWKPGFRVLGVCLKCLPFLRANHAITSTFLAKAFCSKKAAGQSQEYILPNEFFILWLAETRMLLQYHCQHEKSTPICPMVHLIRHKRHSSEIWPGMLAKQEMRHRSVIILRCIFTVYIENNCFDR